jgi:hypothetical protein
MRKFKLISAALVASLLACSGASQAPVDPFAPPSGCAKTVCDQDFAACKNPSCGDPCGECNDTCSRLDWSVADQCLATCARICSRPHVCVDYCGESLNACRQSTRNAQCANETDRPASGGAPADCSPGSIDKVKTSRWLRVSPLHQNICTHAEIIDAIRCWSPKYSSATSAACAARPACAGCALTDLLNGSTQGPVVDYGSSSDIALNEAGCVAATSGARSTVSCGAQMQTVADCARAACETTCPEHHNLELDAGPVVDFDACVKAASEGECAKFNPTHCQAQLEAPGGPSEACKLTETETFAVQAMRYVTLFCGP